MKHTRQANAQRLEQYAETAANETILRGCVDKTPQLLKGRADKDKNRPVDQLVSMQWKRKRHDG